MSKGKNQDSHEYLNEVKHVGLTGLTEVRERSVETIKYRLDHPLTKQDKECIIMLSKNKRPSSACLFTGEFEEET